MCKKLPLQRAKKYLVELVCISSGVGITGFRGWWVVSIAKAGLGERCRIPCCSCSWAASGSFGSRWIDLHLRGLSQVGHACAAFAKNPFFAPFDSFPQVEHSGGMSAEIRLFVSLLMP